MRFYALLFLVAGCAVPDFHSGNLQCASGQRCPSGFHCADDNRCWRDGSDPDLAVGAPDDLAMASSDGPKVDMAAPPRDLRTPVQDLSTTAVNDLGAASKCAASTALLCDGFEAGSLNAQWGIGSTGGTVALDTTRVFRGARALHLHTNAVPDGGAGVEATIAETRTFPQSGNTVYARVWTYIQSPYPITAFNQYLNFLDASDTGIAYVLFNGFPLLNAFTVPNVFTQGSMPPIPLDHWTCIQMSVTQTGTSGTVHLMVDGVDSNASSSGVATTAMTSIHIGPQYNGGGAGFAATDFWIDEVIIDTIPVSCAD